MFQGTEDVECGTEMPQRKFKSCLQIHKQFSGDYLSLVSKGQQCSQYLAVFNDQNFVGNKRVISGKVPEEVQPIWQNVVRVGKKISLTKGLQVTPTPHTSLVFCTVISLHCALNTYSAKQIKLLSGSEQKHGREPCFFLPSHSHSTSKSCSYTLSNIPRSRSLLTAPTANTPTQAISSRPFCQSPCFTSAHPNPPILKIKDRITLQIYASPLCKIPHRLSYTQYKIQTPLPYQVTSNPCFPL